MFYEKLKKMKTVFQELGYIIKLFFLVVGRF